MIIFADGHVFSINWNEKMNGQNRKNIKIGSEVYIVLKKDQRTGKKTKRYC